MSFWKITVRGTNRKGVDETQTLDIEVPDELLARLDWYAQQKELTRAEMLGHLLDSLCTFFSEVRTQLEPNKYGSFFQPSEVTCVKCGDKAWLPITIPGVDFYCDRCSQWELQQYEPKKRRQNPYN